MLVLHLFSMLMEALGIDILTLMVRVLGHNRRFGAGGFGGGGGPGDGGGPGGGGGLGGGGGPGGDGGPGGGGGKPDGHFKTSREIREKK